MKKTRFISAVALMLTVFGACQKEINETVSAVMEDGDVYATVPVPVFDAFEDTKAMVYDGSTLKFAWQKGIDYINVFCEDEKLTCTINEVDSEDPKICTFLIKNFKLMAGKTYYSFYPNSTAVTAENIPIGYGKQHQAVFDDPSSLAANTYMKTPAVVANERNGGNFDFSILSGWLIFKIVPTTDMIIDGLSLSTSSKKFISDGIIDAATGNITTSTLSKSVDLTFGDNGLEASAGVTYKAFLAINPVTLDDLKVTIRGRRSGEVCSFSRVVTFAEPRTFAANHYTSINVNEATCTPDAILANGVGYSSIVDAVSDIPANGVETTLKLFGDVELDDNTGVSIVKGQNLVLDLNGKTMSQVAPDAKSSALITNSGTLKLTGNGTITASAANPSATASYANNTITNCGTLVIDGCTVENTSSTGSCCYAVDNNNSGRSAVLILNSGSIYRAMDKQAVRMFCNSKTLENTLIVNGGSIEGGYAAFNAQLTAAGNKGRIEINGGTIKGGSYSCYDYGSGDMSNLDWVITGGTFIGDYIFSYGANFDVRGGEFQTGYLYVTQNFNPSSVSVSGGHFVDYCDVYVEGTYASSGFITGGTFDTKEYEYESVKYDSYWTYCLASGYQIVERAGKFVVEAA